MTNLSQPYGFYGGVTPQNHYIPPPAPDFIPQPASVTYVNQQRNSLLTLSSAMLSADFTITDYLSSNQELVMFRKLVGKSNGIHTFEINTLANPNDILFYSALSAVTIDMLNFDGGVV